MWSALMLCTHVHTSYCFGTDCIEQDKDITQLLVPKSHQETVFQVAHYIPVAGHVGGGGGG